MYESKRVGVLSLQGDFREHIETFSSFGVEACEVRLPHDLEGLTHLVIPGGESTAISKLMESSGVVTPILEMHEKGLALFGTCAGMILLATEIMGGRDDQLALGAIDIAVARNGFGRQLASFEARLSVKGIGDDPMQVAFIRAPVVVRVGSSVEVLSTVEYEFDGDVRSVPAVCRNEKVLVTSFHPEVTKDIRLHRLFIEDFLVAS